MSEKIENKTGFPDSRVRMAKLDRDLDRQPWWEKFKWELQFKLEILAYHILPKNYELYWGLFWLQYYGYRPIACIPNYCGEYTYIFKTKQEAKKAFDHLESGRWGSRLPSVIGWFYGFDDFKKYIEEDNYDWKNEFSNQEIIWVDHEYKEIFYR